MPMVEKFLDYIKFERNYSPMTVINYRKDLIEFERFYKQLDCQLSWESVDSDVVRNWMEFMMDRGNSASSVNRRLSALRSFYRFALRRKLVDRDPVHGLQGPKRQKPLPQFLKESEMERLLDLNRWTDSYKDVLERTIIITFYVTGIRLSELIGLDDDDIDNVTCEVKVTGKRNKQRIIPFGKELAEVFARYLVIRNTIAKGDSTAFFLTEKGKRMTNAQVRSLVKKNLTKVSTLKKRSPHVLRHTFATAMLNHEAGLESVKKLLGHESLSTTEIYTHTTFEQLKKVYKNAHPRA
ncbi:tyrosine recombinase XerC [Prevotella scopos JCM 17725]|uniref:Tyrosine recombinase XerC n=1 Tax=Prevotella scopos JCM 17725 TaxID=1236518 RepID=A0AAX2F5V1_9BACT|nr:tyrosine recombinase XerC [Prevotella scopos]ANR71969.1 recombinase [Prevotella scopos JCM 17725]QUB45839.1 tyrosine recombinase XerC [Prevotella scopos JCM 17725]SHG02291.1 integrase/recombinase XerC [Prevotella scopos JCM 17725]